jgi:NitT/TauT family transport system substrate-binding protein
MVPSGSPLHSPKDLEGKTIATIEVRGIMEAGIRSWLTRNGADPSGVRFVEMPFGTMVNAAAQGRVDAAFLAEPVLSSARASMREIGNPYAALATVWYTNVWFATADWLTKNTALAHRFVRTIERAGVWANAHQSETGAMLLRYSKLSSDVVATMTRTVFADKLDLNRIQPVLDTAAKYGVLKTPIAARELVMTGF